jgi:hypothetical protein
MKKPKTVKEKIDAAANLVEQMFLSHSIRDENHFRKCHKEAGELLFQVMRQLDEKNDENLP